MPGSGYIEKVTQPLKTCDTTQNTQSVSKLAWSAKGMQAESLLAADVESAES